MNNLLKLGFLLFFVASTLMGMKLEDLDVGDNDYCLFLKNNGLWENRDLFIEYMKENNEFLIAFTHDNKEVKKEAVNRFIQFLVNCEVNKYTYANALKEWMKIKCLELWEFLKIINCGNHLHTLILHGYYGIEDLKEITSESELEKMGIGRTYALFIRHEIRKLNGENLPPLNINFEKHLDTLLPKYRNNN